VNPCGAATDDRATPGRALLIEDDDDIRALEVLLLTEAGWAITQAQSGPEGLSLARDVLPDVVVCDLMLPELDGIEVTRALKADPATAGIPIVLVSALAATDDVVRGIEAGGHDYVTKPFRPVEFLARCHAALRVSMERQRLAATERELRLLADHTSDLVLRCSMDGTIRYASPSVVSMLGWRPEELIGRRAGDLYHADDPSPDAAPAGVPLSDVASVVRRALRADGSFIWIESRAQVVPAADGGFETHSTARDITARLAAEGHYRIAFEGAPVAMAQVGLDGRYLRVNRALLDLFGYSETELLGATETLLSHPEDGGTGVVAAMAAGLVKNHNAEHRYVRGDGEPMWIAVSATAVEGPEGAGVDHILVHYLDITGRKQVEDRLRHMADHDPLTDLLNRRGFDAELHRHIAHSERYGPEGALLLLDIDNFKRVNDTLGHHAGDEVIAAIAGVLRGRLRGSDVLARLGGDEFAVILPHVTQEQADTVADSVVQAIREEVVLLSDGSPIVVTTSIGVAMFDDQPVTATEALTRADVALYAAKAAGRDRYSVFGFARG